MKDNTPTTTSFVDSLQRLAAAEPDSEFTRNVERMSQGTMQNPAMGYINRNP